MYTETTFSKGDRVRVINLNKQLLITSYRLDNINSKENTVGWRDRKPYESVGGWRSPVGCEGEINRHLDLDERFDNKWYAVKVRIDVATYTWLNFHVSELELIPTNNPLSKWLTSK